MKNKIIFWSVLVTLASLWVGYECGYHKGVGVWLAQDQLGAHYSPVVRGHYFTKVDGVPRSLNYQAEPFPAPKPIRPPPLAQPQSKQ